MSVSNARLNGCPLGRDLTPRNLALDLLKPLGRETRKHPAQQIRKIARSLERFGFVLPIVVDDKARVVSGWGLVLAARLLELREIPAVTLTDLSEAELRALRIDLNRLGEEADWDRDALRIELSEIMQLDAGFELEFAGFEIGEIDVLLGDHADEEDEIPSVCEASDAVSRPGDLWILGKHRVFCGDALKEESYAQALGSTPASLVFTDPPYNVPIEGHVSGLGSVTHRDFAMASGEMTSEEFTEFLSRSLGLAARHSTDGAIHFVCMDWRHVREADRGGGSGLQRAEEHLCLEQDQCRHGLALPVQARACARLQVGDRTALEQRRTRQARPPPFERLGLCRSEFPLGGSKRQAFAAYPRGEQEALVSELQRAVPYYRRRAPKAPLLFSICAPCQPFTRLSRKELSEKRRAGRERDSNLLREAIKFVASFQPEMVLSENVGGIKDARHGGIWDEFRSALEELGYITGTRVICTSRFGIPQFRRRSILLAARAELVRSERLTNCGDEILNGLLGLGGQEVPTVIIS